MNLSLIVLLGLVCLFLGPQSAVARQLTATKICGVPVFNENIRQANGETAATLIKKAQKSRLNVRECRENGAHALAIYNHETIVSGHFESRVVIFNAN